MGNTKTKWLIYTVLVGFIPFIVRLMIFLMGTKANFDFLWNAPDFISFGLILHISNINELEHVNGDKEWKTVQNGISIIFIIIYGVLSALTLINTLTPQTINMKTATNYSVALNVISLLLSYTIYDRLSKKTKVK